MTADGDHSPRNSPPPAERAAAAGGKTGAAAAGGRTNVASPGPVPPDQPPPWAPSSGAEDAAAGQPHLVDPALLRRRVAVFLVAGLAIWVRHTPGTAQQASAAVMPAEMFPDALFRELSTDIQARNEAAFLSLAAASARPALTTWWDNLRAIGFTTGAVLPTVPLDAVPIDSHGNGTAVVLAGAHSPLDPVDDLGKPQIPMARYRMGLHFASPGATGQITSWRPLDDAPWDSASPLYVRKAAYVVVASLLRRPRAGRPDPAGRRDRGRVRHQDDGPCRAGFPAAAWLRRLRVRGAPRSGTAGSRPTRSRPGWPPRFLGAQAIQLPGPGVSDDRPGVHRQQQPRERHLRQEHGRRTGGPRACRPGDERGPARRDADAGARVHARHPGHPRRGTGQRRCAQARAVLDRRGARRCGPVPVRGEPRPGAPFLQLGDAHRRSACPAAQLPERVNPSTSSSSARR